VKLITDIGRLVLIASLGCVAHWTAAASAQTNGPIRIVELRGTVEILTRGSDHWLLTPTNQILYPLDRVRTGTNSSVGLLWSDQSVLRFDALTELEILPPQTADGGHGLHLLNGLLSFFHRGKPGRIRVITSGAFAGIEGTEFVMEVHAFNGVEQTTLSVIDGQVLFGSASDTLVFTNGQQGVTESGKAPVRTSGFIANNLLQWCFYYPGVLDLKDLPLTAAEQTMLGESLAEYRDGDLLKALAKYPGTRRPGSDAERVYHAALMLGAGQVAEAEAELSTLTSADVSEKSRRVGAALRALIAAIRREPRPSVGSPQLPTEYLAASYFEQSRAIPGVSLQAALELARLAVTNSPGFGFGWERVAELEFSFGRTDRATAALAKASSLSHRNAQAIALQGFLLAAQNRTREAIAAFDRALAVDSALGNAWLGRGLCRIRRGDLVGGREDLLIAAGLEPQRAALRSYLAKAWSETGDDARAFTELQRAKALDLNDPTAWLYSALLDEQDNRINEAIRELEKSQELNNNRGVYRSGLLLDQDRAVRGANLARIYDEAGLDDVAIREAGGAVAADYTSASAHLFLENAYDQARASTPFGQRFETPAFSEYLITALLGSTDPRLLAQQVSQQEYTRLFDRDGVGFSSSTDYLSRGAWNQYGSQYGTLGSTSYALEGNYQSDPGQAANANFESSTISLAIKQKLGSQDSLFLRVYETRLTGGDLSQHYNPEATVSGLTYEEKQSPNILLGYHREWSPDSHTLVLASRFDDRAALYDPAGFALLLGTVFGEPGIAVPTDLTRTFSRHYTANALEFQQLQKLDSHNLIFGVRLQLNYENVLDQDVALPNNLSGPQMVGEYVGLVPYEPFPYPTQPVSTENWRTSFYAYDYWQVNDYLQLFGGITEDYLQLARNTIAPPLSSDHESVNYVSPKAGLLWQPGQSTAFRLGYFRSITGQDLDQSIRLEPTELFGLPVVFRTAFPDSIVGSLSGERVQVWQADGRFRLGRNTYAVLGLQEIQSRDDRQVGAYTSDFFDNPPNPLPVQVGESLRFEEQSLHLSLHQLVGNNASLGVVYEVARARLNQNYDVSPSLDVFTAGVLHSLTFSARANTRSGFFAETDAVWHWQTSLTDTSLSGALPDERFWQINVSAGYRSPRRRFECLVGLLNLTDQDYHLHPINLFLDLPRQRTLALTTRFNF
jgi:tetratricopeptide (TPR) repeat protein